MTTARLPSPNLARPAPPVPLRRSPRLKLRDGSLKVFDTATFTVNGETVTSAPCDMTIMDWATGTVAYQGETYEGIVDGAFEESTFRSAPYFTLRIDGIVEDAQ